MDDAQLRRHRLRNAAQSTLLMAAILLLTWWIAHAFFGPGTGIWLLLGAGLGMLLSPRVPYDLILRMQGGVPLGPRQAPQLYEALQTLTVRAGLERCPRLFYLPRPELNAFAIGRRDDAIIGVTDGLLRRMEHGPLIAILAHEIAHVVHGDMWVMQLTSSAARLVGFLAFVAWFLLLVNLPLAVFGVNAVPIAPLLVILAMPTVLVVMQMALSRTREYAADLESARLTGRPEWLASALRTLEAAEYGLLEHMRVGRQSLALFSSHPPTQERVRRLRELQPATGPDWALENLLRQLVVHELSPRLRRRPWWWV